MLLHRTNPTSIPTTRPLAATLLAATLLACSPGSGGDDPGVDAGPPPNPAPELGFEDKSQGVGAEMVRVATKLNRLNEPRDLAFNPLEPGQLWVPNRADDSMVIITDAHLDTRTFLRRKDGYALHFMEETAALAFGAEETTFGSRGTFATCGESRNTYNDQAPHNDFMGPALWTSDLDVFAMEDPIGLGSHIDMLHHTPLCMGIAHEAANAYWVTGGLDGALYWYDFGDDHDIGMDDHSDGRIKRYAAGEFERVPDVPSHLVFHIEDSHVYYADTGGGRIAKLDTTTGKRGRNIPKPEPVVEAYAMDDAVVTEVVPASSGILKRPSGLEIHKDRLFVSDNETGIIHAFKLDGTHLNSFDTGLGEGALSGLAFGPDDRLYFVDMKNDEVLRIEY